MCVCVCLWWLILPPATCLQHHYLNKSNFAQNVSTEWLIWINEWHDIIFALVWLTPNRLQKIRMVNLQHLPAGRYFILFSFYFIFLFFLMHYISKTKVEQKVAKRVTVEKLPQGHGVTHWSPSLFLVVPLRCVNFASRHRLRRTFEWKGIF